MTASIEQLEATEQRTEKFAASLENLKKRTGKRPLGFLKGRIRVDADVKQLGGDELIRLFEGRI